MPLRSGSQASAAAEPLSGGTGVPVPRHAGRPAAAVTAYAGYYNFHRLHGAIGWQTPADRLNGTSFADRGFEHVPSLTAVADLLADLLAA